MATKEMIKAGIVNEGDTQVERLAVKIIKLPGESSTFVKTCALLTDGRNLGIIKQREDELTPTASKGFLGIGIVSYADINYIEFYSALKSFPLRQTSVVTFFFRGGKEIPFEFRSVNKGYGFMKRNNCFITNETLTYISETPLDYWRLENKVDKITLFGGFECHDHNLQYKSKKGGQQLLQNMVKEILKLKPILKAG